VFDHVLGATLDRFDRLGRRRPYTDESPFHEVSSSSVTCCSQRLEPVTGIVILPQRQTALVAKQAAAVDVRTGGRVRLGVGIGWNTPSPVTNGGLPASSPTPMRVSGSR
jgi:alkanesulfonate monooxygenase SsuD/methylene tetrahydromethanopterin reductase-like flavin-dependent oxidoreductase (luciferase family)